MKSISEKVRACIYNQYKLGAAPDIQTDVNPITLASTWYYSKKIKATRLIDLSDVDILRLADIDDLLTKESKIIRDGNVISVQSYIDDELYELCVDCKDCFIFLKKEGKCIPFMTALSMYQYLQARQYALPYLGYTVEDLIELNVFKIVENEK
jgi:hypothetical protein